MITGYLKPDAGRDRARRPRHHGARPARDRAPRRGALVPDSAAVRRADGARQHAGRQRLPRPAPALLAAGAHAPRRCARADALLRALRARRAPRAPRRRAARRRAQAARHRDGAHRPAASCCCSTSRPAASSAEEKFPMMDTIMTALGERARRRCSSSSTTWTSSRATPSRVIAFYSGRIIADDAPGDGAGHRRRAPLRHRRAAAGMTRDAADRSAPRRDRTRCRRCAASRSTVADGTHGGLVGRNGAGKTTLMRTVMGHLRAEPGPHHLRRRRTCAPAAPRARRRSASATCPRTAAWCPS